MQHGVVNDESTYGDLLQDPVWKEVFSWLKTNAAQLPDGEHTIRGRDLYANTHTAPTIPREQGMFEAHQEYIDLHYCLSGGEVIEWAPAEQLTLKQMYDPAKDYALYEVPPSAASLILFPGMFALFLPGEAHMPKITDGKHAQVRKVVIKIINSVL